MEETLTQPARRSRRLARWHLPTVFAAVFLAFCLPLATVSCNGAKTTFTGMQLVTQTVPRGGTFQDEDGHKSELSDRVESNSSGTAALVLAFAALGLLLGVLRLPGTGWCASLGLLAAAALGSNGVFPLGPDVAYHWGYWATLLLFGWACLVHLRRRAREGRLGPPPTRYAPGASGWGPRLHYP